MTPFQIIRAAIPNAGDDVVDHVLWGRTPFPVSRPSAREIYKAASGWRRACANNILLCDFCDAPALPDHWECASCSNALAATRALQATCKRALA